MSVEFPLEVCSAKKNWGELSFAVLIVAWVRCAVAMALSFHLKAWGDCTIGTISFSTGRAGTIILISNAGLVVRVMKTFQEACVKKAWIDLAFQAFWRTTHTLNHTTLCHQCYTIPKTSAMWLVCSLLFADLNVVHHQWHILLYIPCTACFYGEIRHTDRHTPSRSTVNPRTCIWMWA